MSRRRAAAIPAPVSRGTQIEVSRGGVVFRQSHTHVQCALCEAIAAVGDGSGLPAFYAAHTHRATTPAPPADLAAVLAQLGPDELEVVAEVARGLRAGRAIYGELRIDTDQRDHVREALDEIRDGLVYAAVAAIKRRRAVPA